MRTTLHVLYVILLVVIHVATFGYFVPWWVAAHRHAPNKGSVIVINILLGWSLVGWAVALAMAVRDHRE